MKRWIALALLIFLAACSSSASKPQQPPNPPAGTTAAGATPSKPATSGGGNAPDCPLKAEQVTAVIGEPMKLHDVAGACAFRPASGNLLPSAVYNKQYAFLMDDPASLDYTEALPGVGDKAYIARRGDGTWVICKVGGKAFEVHVDSANATRDRGYAIALAKVVVGLI